MRCGPEYFVTKFLTLVQFILHLRKCWILNQSGLLVGTDLLLELFDLCNESNNHDVRQNNLEVIAADCTVNHERQLQGLYINRYISHTKSQEESEKHLIPSQTPDKELTNLTRARSLLWHSIAGVYSAIASCLLLRRSFGAVSVHEEVNDGHDGKQVDGDVVHEAHRVAGLDHSLISAVRQVQKHHIAQVFAIGQHAQR